MGLTALNECARQLQVLSQECQLENWDGFGALAVSSDSLRSVYRLLRSCPNRFPPPTVGAEPDGEITLEWHRDANHTLSVSVSGCGKIHFSAIIGASIANGTITKFDAMPRELTVLIDRILSRTVPAGLSK